jgi:hypothetical protein
METNVILKINKLIAKKILVILCCCVFPDIGKSQQKEIPILFQDTQPLALGLSFSIKEVKKSEHDSIFFPSYLAYKNDHGEWDSLQVGIRARGNFRRKHCYFPPLRLKIKKSQVAGTPFEGNKSFKLVLPCQNVKSAGNLILREYLCYKLLEPITPYFFHTRLAYITLTDQRGKQSNAATGFLIEDDDLIAHRFKGKVLDQIILPGQLNDTAAVIHDFFEFLIANTDWSTTMQHNTKVIQLPPNRKIPISYDFDMAGLVNAPYATINEALEIKSVQERLYRGYCRDESIMEYVRAKYIRLEPEIMDALSNYQSYFNENEFPVMKKYIEEFFIILKDDKKFKYSILQKCRAFEK